MSSSSGKATKMVYVGPDEWHGPIYLEHGRIYDLMISNKRTGSVSVDILGIEDHPKVLAYPNEKKFEKYWRGV